MSIKWKFMILVVAVIIATSAAVAIASLYESEEIISDEVKDHLVTTVQSRASHIETFISSQKTTAEMMAAQISPYRSYMKENEGQIPPGIMDFAMKTDIEAITNGGHMLVLDKSGELLFGMGKYGFQLGVGGIEGMNLAHWEVFEEAQKDVCVMDTRIQEITKGNVIAVATSFYVDDEFDGVVVIIGGEGHLKEITGDLTGLGKTGEVYIVNAKGFMLTPSRFSVEEEQYEEIDLDSMFEKAQYGETVFGVGLVTSLHSYTGADVISAHVRLPETNWTVIAEMERSEAYAPITDLSWTIFWIVAVLCAVGLLFTFILSKIAINPLLRLKRGAESILDGNLDHQTGIMSKDEIGMVSRAFDEMVVGLKKSREQVEDHTRDLEVRVKERTAELEATNAALHEEIGERKRVEHQLKDQTAMLVQTEKLRSMGTMVGGVAHELNNPMTGIIQFTQFCLRRTEVDDRRHSVLKDIEQEARRCSAIIRNLMTFSRMESEGEEYFQKEDMASLVDRVLQLLSYRIRAEQVSVTQHHDESMPAVPIKVNSIQQVLLHLLGNAMDAVETNDSEGRSIQIESNINDGFVEVRVIDNGPGISSENMQKVFDPFFTTKSVGKGMGLGLSISQSICVQHGGSLKCESHKETGAIFTMSLPIERN